MIKEEQKYEEWLTTIVNTRFLYNTMDEIEAMLDNHSIHSNGIKRSFNTPQKMRSAFRDLKVEAYSLTDETLLLDKVLIKYRKSWDFYKTYLARRSNPHDLALELLQYVYYPDRRDSFSNRKKSIFNQVIDDGVSASFLSLMLLKVIPGYDSKDGDVIDFARQFESAMSLLETFTEGGTMFNVLPVITRARSESNKTRFMVYYHFSNILDTFESYNCSENIYDTSSALKQLQVELNIDGFWNECGGEAIYTEFWQIEPTINGSTYFATHWHKDSSNILTGIRYTLFLSEADDGDVIAYIVHPELIKNRMKGKRYVDSDHAWYKFSIKEDSSPKQLPLRRAINSSVWPLNIDLTKVTDKNVIQYYESWMENCDIVKPFGDCEYEFYPNMYAITEDYIYIPAENDNEYYQVPKDAYEGLDKVQFGDNVGTMLMDNRLYLAFDEFMLYIATTKNELKKYGIKKVNRIE